MKHPPYPLRPNKAVDRFMLVEAIRCIGRPSELAQYTYYGLGGPYLEDFRLLHENFPEMNMTSIEQDSNTYKQQLFHQPCKKIQLRRIDFKSFLVQSDLGDKKSIFWLDYTGLEYGQFEDFKLLLGKVATRSIIKITLRAEPSDYYDKPKEDEFKSKFGAVLPSPDVTPPRDLERLASLLQKMLQIAAQQAFSGTGFVYQPISSFFYKDGVGIFTLTGIICERAERKQVRSLFSGWRFANLNWKKPRLIDVPFLSTKERLHLQKQLPCEQYAGRKLLKVLGYTIDKDRPTALDKMQQYAEFYRHYPYFIRAIP